MAKKDEVRKKLRNPTNHFFQATFDELVKQLRFYCLEEKGSILREGAVIAIINIFCATNSFTLQEEDYLSRNIGSCADMLYRYKIQRGWLNKDTTTNLEYTSPLGRAETQEEKELRLRICSLFTKLMKLEKEFKV